MWHTVHTVTGRAAVSLWRLCVCLCVCVFCMCGRMRQGKELTLNFMIVSIMLSSKVHCYSSVIRWTRSEAEEERLRNIALIAFWTVSLPCSLSEEEPLTSLTSSLSLLYNEMKPSAHEMAATLPKLTPISQLKIFCLWEQISWRKLSSNTLNKYCSWLAGKGYF